MEKWFRARLGRIEEVEVERATNKFVVLHNGNRDQIDSNWTWYRKSRAEAKAVMVSKYEKDRDAAIEKLKFYENRLSLAKDA